MERRGDCIFPFAYRKAADPYVGNAAIVLLFAPHKEFFEVG